MSDEIAGLGIDELFTALLNQANKEGKISLAEEEEDIDLLSIILEHHQLTFEHVFSFLTRQGRFDGAAASKSYGTVSSFFVYLLSRRFPDRLTADVLMDIVLSATNAAEDSVDDLWKSRSNETHFRALPLETQLQCLSRLTSPALDSHIAENAAFALMKWLALDIGSTADHVRQFYVERMSRTGFNLDDDEVKAFIAAIRTLARESTPSVDAPAPGQPLARAISRTR